MNEEYKNAAGWVAAVVMGFILLFVWGSDGNSSSSSTSSADYEDKISQLESDLEDAKSCISEFKDYSSELEGTIDEASQYTDSSYEEMNDALGSIGYSSSPSCD